MKTVICILIGILIGACGGDPTPSNNKQCYGDQDCPSMSKCLDNVCIDRPECLTDTECTDKDPTFACVLGKCAPYIEKDACYNQPCGATIPGECTSCGVFTTCHMGICQDACEAKEENTNVSWDIICSDPISVCLECICWKDGHKKRSGTTGCKEQIPTMYTSTDAKECKLKLEEVNYEESREEGITYWKEYCSKPTPP